MPRRSVRIASAATAPFSPGLGAGAGRLRRTEPTIRMMTAATSGQGARKRRAGAKLDWPVLTWPTIIGPTEPPRLPVMLMKPMAAAAAVGPRNIVGIGQKAGRWAYWKV